MNNWSGLFAKNLDEKMRVFNSSINFDYKLLKYDIIATIAHIKMLGKISILTDEEVLVAVAACQKLLQGFENGTVTIDFASEDVHFFVQSELQKIIGDLAKKIHTGRSRNDQIATDLRLYTREAITQIALSLKIVIKKILDIARQNTDTIMPAYTHLQQAQPTSLAHYFCCYAEMLFEDIERLNDLQKRVNKLPLGSSSVCGSCLPLDRDFVAKELGFDGLIENSMNAVSNRDFIIEFCSVTSILMLHLSRLCEDIITYSSTEFGFFILDDAFCTGSSLMPNKKNPDLLELIRGKSGRIFGNLMAILTIMKGLPMSYNKDMQEDKKSLFENAEITIECLDILEEFLPSLTFNKDKMALAVQNSHCLATDLLDYLVKKGEKFKIAHEIIAKLTSFATAQKKWFYQLTLQDFKGFSSYFDDDLFDLFKEPLKNHITKGSPNPQQIQKFIEKIYAKC